MEAETGMRPSGSNVLDSTYYGPGCGSLLYSTLPLGPWPSSQWSNSPGKPAQVNTKTTSHGLEDMPFWYSILKCISPPRRQHQTPLPHNLAHRITAWKSARLEQTRRNRRTLRHQMRSPCGDDLQWVSATFASGIALACRSVTSIA